ncbi:MAG: tRNA (adenosine(37)-N6)-threonylcarbamoyltransferase complex dimerization subunit type 1 TsaB [Eubacteriales bacterium]|nr:tRNA (adenosine(37)-N6)-threonylcarbamoyltransferase complex dimerization subunit type 1 TsaB [Eubacteriales bacterium]
MMILVLETTGPLASVALIDQSRNVTERLNDTRYSHLEELIPMVQALMGEKSTYPEDIAAIAVSRGPGSFTGVRIGMTTAKALAQIWQKPIVEVPTLTAFAFHGGIAPGTLVVPVLDARRNQVYGGAYRKTEPYQVSEVIGEKAWALKELLELLADRQQEGEPVLFCGDGVRVYGDVLENYPKPFQYADEEAAVQRASTVAQLALNLYQAGIVTDAFHAEPVYLRQAEAERKLQEKCVK